MNAIKSRTSDEYLTSNGHLGSFEEAAKYSDKVTANLAMAYWGLEGVCRVRRVLVNTK